MSDRPGPQRLGVGFLGAGPVTQAIHLPTLARLTDLFRVATVLDLDPDVAATVAARAGARPTTSIEDLLADEDVEVVAVCSPHQFHAEQVIAACRAGKRGVLCEKPFAMTAEEATAIAEVSAETGVPIVVGAMHIYDPGWRAAVRVWDELGAAAHTVRSSIVLPPNPRFEDFATEVVERPAAGAADLDDPEVAAAMVHEGVMGLAIHDLPLARTFLGGTTEFEVLHAAANGPFGYLIVLRCGGRTVELHAVMSRNWDPSWALHAIAEDAALSVEFTPSYVQAGSATAAVHTADGTRVLGPFDHNGYEGEWRHLAELTRGATPLASTAESIEDLVFALTLAERARDVVLTSAAVEVSS